MNDSKLVNSASLASCTNGRGLSLPSSVVRVVWIPVLMSLLLACSFHARSPDQYRDDTSTLLATKGAELNTCYDNAVKTTPGLSGKVTVRFAVEKKTGKIINVTSDPSRTTAAQPLIDCVVNSINGLVLAPPDEREGDATFEYDFARPSQAAQAPQG